MSSLASSGKTGQEAGNTFSQQQVMPKEYEAGFCLRTRSVDGEKVFLNICHTEIDKPSNKYSVYFGSRNRCLDSNEKEQCSVFNVVLDPSGYKMFEKYLKYLNNPVGEITHPLISMIENTLATKHDLHLLNEYREVEEFIFYNPGIEVEEKRNNFSADSPKTISENTDKADSNLDTIKIKKAKLDRIKQIAKQKYVMKWVPCNFYEETHKIPDFNLLLVRKPVEYYVLEVDLKNVKFRSDIKLSLTKETIYLETYGDVNYRLHFSFNKPVKIILAVAEFDPSTQVLTTYLPLAD